MRLGRSLIRLEFSTPTEPFEGLRRLLRGASGDEKLEFEGQPIQIDRDPGITRVILNVRALEVHRQLIDDEEATAEDANASALQIVEELNEAGPFPGIAKAMSRLSLIEPVEMAFGRLKDRIVRRYLQPQHDLVTKASDIALVFDRKEGEQLRSLQIGPMEPPQLQAEHLIWKAKGDLPRTFIFVEASYSTTELSEEAYSPDALRSALLQPAARWQTSASSDIFQTILKG